MTELRVFETQNTKDQKEVVELLEDWLAIAKKGELVAIALAGVGSSGDGCNGWASGLQANALLGVITLLQFRLCEAIHDETARED